MFWFGGVGFLEMSACLRLSLCGAGLQILFTLLQSVAQEEAAAQSFYQTYFCDILQHIFSVVTDTSHTAGKYASQAFLESRKSSETNSGGALMQFNK